MKYERVGHFQYQPMPGGDLATRQPWRMALSYLLTSCGQLQVAPDTFKGIAENELRLVAQATEKGINAPLTSSCGRLFDAVSAILGLRQTVSFEGQAAMDLEMIADPRQASHYPYELSESKGQIIFDPNPLIRSLVDDLVSGLDKAIIAGRFHYTRSIMIAEVCVIIRQKTSLNKVVLSGGVFQNCLLTELTVARLEKAGFKVLTHSLVPPNDGGLALGQAAVAAAKFPGLMQV